MNKNAVIVFLIIIFVFGLIALVCFPKILKEYEAKCNKIVISNCRDFTKSVLSKENSDLDKTVDDLILEFNEKYKNPISKKNDAFINSKKCEGCVAVEYNKEIGSVSVTGYDKDLKILCRNVIKPPSYVSYEREE